MTQRFFAAVASALVAVVIACAEAPRPATPADPAPARVSTDRVDNDDAGEGLSCDAAAFDASCKTGCPFGYNVGADGCRMCSCLDLGREPDARGCPQYLECPQNCSNGHDGYKSDERGCLTCECGVVATNDNDDAGEGLWCDAAAFDASCKTGCPFGYNVGADGCRVCSCLDLGREPDARGCPQYLECPQNCSNGHDGYKSDERGCLTCECG